MISWIKSLSTDMKILLALGVAFTLCVAALFIQYQWKKFENPEPAKETANAAAVPAKAPQGAPAAPAAAAPAAAATSAPAVATTTAPVVPAPVLQGPTDWGSWTFENRVPLVIGIATIVVLALIMSLLVKNGFLIFIASAFLVPMLFCAIYLGIRGDWTVPVKEGSLLHAVVALPKEQSIPLDSEQEGYTPVELPEVPEGYIADYQIDEHVKIEVFYKEPTDDDEPNCILCTDNPASIPNSIRKVWVIVERDANDNPVKTVLDIKYLAKRS